MKRRKRQRLERIGWVVSDAATSRIRTWLPSLVALWIAINRIRRTCSSSLGRRVRLLPRARAI